MNPEIKLDATGEAFLNYLKALFGNQAAVGTAYINDTRVIDEFRPGGVAKDSDLTGFSKPQSEWAFGGSCGLTQDTTICAVVFSRRSQFESFLRANVPLQSTLITHWHGARVVWLRVKGSIPYNFAADGVHWCSTGFIPVACPNQATDTFISQVGEIKLVDFDEIRWEERQQETIEKILISMEVGPPFRVGARNRKLLNLAFWGRYFTSLMPISFDPGRNLLAIGDPKAGIPPLLGDDAMIREFTQLLHIAAASFGAEFPHGEIRPDRVRQLVQRIKMLTTQSRLSDDEVLETFLTTRLALMPDKVITCQEIREAFLQFSHYLGRAPMRPARFFKTLRAKLGQLGIDPRHDLLRNGKNVRGYSGLSLKLIAPVSNADVSDAADATDGVPNTCKSSEFQNNVASQ